jgi:tetratricopeptide (TPR) repeat protein
VGCLCLTLGRVAAADTVYRRSTEKRAAGEITSLSKTEVTVTPKVGAPTTVPAGDIEFIEWDGEPAALGLARSKASAGQYALAITDFETALKGLPTGKPRIAADIAYGLATARARLAMADATQQADAVSGLQVFLKEHPEHYRYFDALLVLGELHLAGDRSVEADQVFQQVASAPWTDYQMAARVALGRAAMARGDLAAARRAFDEVARMTAKTPAEQTRRLEAMLGQSTCLRSQGQFAEAVTLLDQVIRECPVEQARLQAEAYVRQGDCYVALGDKSKEAVLAYLHVDVIPTLSKEADLHAEALFQLARLWPELGHPARADLAAGRLQSLYPNSEWTRKLGEG